jgi:hypothetical protein
MRTRAKKQTIEKLFIFKIEGMRGEAIIYLQYGADIKAKSY